MSHLGPHVETVSKYSGVEAFYEIKFEYQEFADERHDKSLNNAYRGIDKRVKELSDQLV